MLEGLYSAAAGMAAQQTRIDAVSNDLANTDTTGYKHVRVAFRDLVYTQSSRSAVKGVLLGAGAAASQVGRSTVQGADQRTDRTLDVAIQGPGYLQVKTSDGKVAVTRDGNLRRDAQGRLGLQSGELLQPPVKIPVDTPDADISINGSGQISAGGKLVGQLKLVDVPAPAGLQPGPSNTFIPTRASGAIRNALPTTTVAQGALEASNVDVGQAMTELMESQRAFSLASKAINTQDQMMQIANEIKR